MRISDWSSDVCSSDLDQDIPRDRLLNAIMRKAEAVRGPITAQTAGVHLDMLARTYAAATDDASADDILGSPFQELGLMLLVAPAGVRTVRLVRGSKPSTEERRLGLECGRPCSVRRSPYLY